MKEISKQDIDTLVNLQKAETEIVRLQSVLEKVEKEKAGLELKLNAFEAALNKQTQTFENYARLCRETEQEIKIIDARIIKSNETLRMVKTNKEYQVLLREVDDNKKRKDSVETELLELLEEKEKSESIATETKREFDLLREHTRAGQAGLDKQSSDDRAALEEYLEQQKKIGESLDPSLMTLFKRISKMNNGSAVARVKNQVCTGCFMNIPPQMYIEVQRGNSLISCPLCSRILYYAEMKQ